ncbi:hypothetical protein [Dethiosulfatarculus sandiegensis]|uniref:Uncharacterized protein n=1 Tax=Dethiosulfatarculus sandiegensis TaxID=1429043 RepID=A0A0D2J7P3_9BACT|nr:hypothetical protein [Dethiosulfatarculus sandiegensis]KIX11751.1 hypothetical protein X474_22620 [Dethiosulfatarculus sandiegensis]
MEPQEQALAIIRGLLIPMSWSKNGNITALGIAASDEQDYLLEFPGDSRDYLPHLRKKVEVKGVIDKQTKGKNILQVKQIKVISRSK